MWFIGLNKKQILLMLKHFAIYNFSISACFVSSTYSRNRFLIKLYITSLRINITQNLSQFDTWRFVIKAGESSASRLKCG